MKATSGTITVEVGAGELLDFTPPPRTVSLNVVSEPLVAQPADAFLGCGIAQHTQIRHCALRPASDSAGGGSDHA